MLTLRCTYNGLVPVEAEAIAPDRLATLSLSQVASCSVYHGNRPATLGDFFEIEGDPSDANVRIEGDCSRIKWLGSGMAGGCLTVRGSVGAHLASGMTGGCIDVDGNADDWCGAEMRGGHIRIRGSVGHKAGAAYPGSRRGMRGGLMLVEGNAGNDLGSVMRRGTIAVAGGVGEFAGAAMIAGSLLLFGKVGPYVGAGLNRGTIVTFADRPDMLPTFLYDCTHRPQFVTLYLRHLLASGFAVPATAFAGRFDRFRGDVVARGKGEVLVWRS
ncbi:MAG: formylmethanofuran dehydrogenase subunit C [Gemmataceae bacterium]